MLSRVTVKNVGDVFFRDTVYIKCTMAAVTQANASSSSCKLLFYY